MWQSELEYNEPMFSYFKDHLEYSFTSDGPTECASCGEIKICHSLSGSFGDTGKSDLCFHCIKNGVAMPVDCWLNEALPDESVIKKYGQVKADEIANVITYCTPSLPTWQDMQWPCVDGDFGVFIKLASQHDFIGPADLHSCIPIDELYGHSPDKIWERIPDKPITSLKDGNYDCSFYLFESNGKRVVTWDMS